MNPLLEIVGLKRHFGGLWATNGVDLTVTSGEIHALIGPNGAGKTTLVHLISGGLMPDEGHLRFAGTDITRLSMHERVALGVTRSYQITQVFPQLPLLENVRLAVQARRRDFGSSLRFWRPASADFHLIEEAEEWLGRVGLAEQAGTHACDLSHGEQRALELAMALATRPRLLLLDEPLAGMGPEESAHMARLIESLKGEQTVLLVEHDMDVVFRLADRISVLVAGRVVASGTPDAVRADPEVRRAYLGDEAA
ncbi:MAG: ABC transporter ATP-binding protein [Rhodocyclaceae bacterium]|jgi:branched-chain amino acid transport system ATP-binding protein|nr:ABC transporter ATP-binding protein [Rhodocyclaceae bacterium]